MYLANTGGACPLFLKGLLLFGWVFRTIVASVDEDEDEEEEEEEHDYNGCKVKDRKCQSYRISQEIYDTTPVLRHKQGTQYEKTKVKTIEMALPENGGLEIKINISYTNRVCRIVEYPDDELGVPPDEDWWDEYKELCENLFADYIEFPTLEPNTFML